MPQRPFNALLPARICRLHNQHRTVEIVGVFRRRLSQRLHGQSGIGTAQQSSIFCALASKGFGGGGGGGVAGWAGALAPRPHTATIARQLAAQTDSIKAPGLGKGRTF